MCQSEQSAANFQQSKDERVFGRNCRTIRHRQNTRQPDRQAHFCHYSYSFERCTY